MQGKMIMITLGSTMSVIQALHFKVRYQFYNERLLKKVVTILFMRIYF